MDARYHARYDGGVGRMVAIGLLVVSSVAAADEPAAKVERARGKVTADGHAIVDGAPLGAGATVIADTGSAAELTLPRGNVEVRGGARVVVRDGAVEITSGTVRARGQVAVTTQAARLTLPSGGEAIVTAGEGATRVGVIAGGPVVVAGRHAKLALAAGSATMIVNGRDPAPARALPQAPAWAHNSSIFLANDGKSGIVRVVWAEVPSASTYHVDVDGGSAGDTSEPFYTGTLAAGTHTIVVAAVDGDHVEGRRTPPLTVKVVPATLAGAPVNLSSVLLLGARVRAPQGLRCSAESGQPAREVLLNQTGSFNLECRDAAGQATLPVPIEVVSPTVRLSASGPFAAGRAGTVTVEVPAGLLPRVRVVGPPGVRVSALRPSSRTQAQVDVTAVAAGPITLTALVDSAESGGDVPLPVAQTEVQVELASEAAIGLEIGPFASHSWFYSDFVIGDHGAADRAILGGLSVSIDVTPHLALEGELAVGSGSFESGDSALVGETAARILVHLTTGRVRPFIGLGGGVIQAFPGTRASGEAVAGMKMGRGWGLRVEARERVTHDQGGLAAATEVRGSLYFEL